MKNSSQWSGKTYWIVGASAGLGRHLAEKLSQAGARLVLSARDVPSLDELAASLPNPCEVVQCDVTELESVRFAFQKIERMDTPLDGMIYCAGQYAPMRAQRWDNERVLQIMDVNLMGAARVLGCYIPYMMERKTGHVALIGSLAGIRGLPGATGYGPSKGGLIHMAECLKADLPKDGFKIQVINPGFIKTRLTDQNTFKMPFILDPDDAAERTLKALGSSRFSTDYPTRFAMWFRIMKLLPDALYFPLIRAISPR